ncbi:MAG: ATP synthase F0 subunit B [Myxococcota bacterium]
MKRDLCKWPVKPQQAVVLVVAAVVTCLVSGVAQASGGEHASDQSVLKDMLFQALNLALLLGVLFYFGRKPIAEFFAGRREGIATELSEAADLLRQAEERNTDLQRRLTELDAEIDGIRDEAGRRAEEEAARILTDAQAAAERIQRDAKAAVAQELRRAQATLRDEAADLAIELAAQKLSEQVVDADRDRLVDEFIARIEPNANEGTNQ